MAIGPILHQGVIQRSQDIGQVKLNQDAKPMVDQSNIQTQFQKDLEHNTKQVIKSNEAELKENRFDAKEGGKGSAFFRERENKKHSDQKANDKATDRVIKKDSGSFDVKI